MVRLSQIDSQPLSDLACIHFLCKACGIIDQDWNRARTGSQCFHCKTEGNGASFVFPISIHVLVDLIQQSYHSNSPTSPLNSPQGSDVGPILYFCTLREALLNSLLINHLRALKVPQPLIEKLLSDNKLASQKFGGLFTTVIGVKWDEAVSAASQRSGCDYSKVSDLMRAAAERRNEFLHSGRAWAINREFATLCVDSVAELTGLFVELHNEYTSPLLRDA